MDHRVQPFQCSFVTLVSQTDKEERQSLTYCFGRVMDFWLTLALRMTLMWHETLCSCGRLIPFHCLCFAVRNINKNEYFLNHSIATFLEDGSRAAKCSSSFTSLLSVVWCWAGSVQFLLLYAGGCCMSWKIWKCFTLYRVTRSIFVVNS